MDNSVSVYHAPVHPLVHKTLRSRAVSIRCRWEALLRVEGGRTPLGNPDMLISWIPASLNGILDLMAKMDSRAVTEIGGIRWPRCECGHNPYVAFYRSGEQAILEALVLIQAESANVKTRDDDLASAQIAVRTSAVRDIESFCGVCVLRRSQEPGEGRF